MTLCYRLRPASIIDPTADYFLRVKGHRGRCECGWEGDDRIFPQYHADKLWGYDTDRSKKAAVLDTTRHRGKLKPRTAGGTARPKDMQGKKLYAAEDKVFRVPDHPMNKVIGTSIEDSQRWLKENILDQPWFIERWGKRSTKVISGSGSNAVYSGRIRLATWGRVPWVICHEMAHVLASPREEASHGAQYAAVYVFLVEHALGATHAKRLRGEFIRGKVKYKDDRFIPAVKIKKAA